MFGSLSPKLQRVHPPVAVMTAPMKSIADETHVVLLDVASQVNTLISCLYVDTIYNK